MATSTTNLKLTKPALGESADVTVLNANWDKVDTAVGNKLDVEGTAKRATSDANGNVIATFYQKKITISTSEPSASDGEDGDLWFVYE